VVLSDDENATQRSKTPKAPGAQTETTTHSTVKPTIGPQGPRHAEISVEQAKQRVQISEPTSVLERRIRQPKRKPSRAAIIAVCTSLAIALLVTVFAGLFRRSQPGPVVADQKSPSPQGPPLTSIENETLRELEAWQGRVSFATASAVGSPEAHFTLVEGPVGLTVDRQTGVIRWQPTEFDGPGDYEVVVGAVVGETTEPYTKTSFRLAVQEENAAPEMVSQKSFVVRADEILSYHAVARDPDSPQAELTYSLGPGAPQNARIQPENGLLTWRPGQDEIGKTIEIEIRATETAPSGLSATQRLTVRVEPSETSDRELLSDGTAPRPETEPQPPTSIGPSPQRMSEALSDKPVGRLLDDFRERQIEVEVLGKSTFAPFAGDGYVVKAAGEEVLLLEYASPEAARADAVQISGDATEYFGKLVSWKSPPRFYLREQIIALYTGNETQLIDNLDVLFGRPFANAQSDADDSHDSQAAWQPSPFDEELLALYRRKQLWSQVHYALVRHIFADRFASLCASQITLAFGEDFDDINKWFDHNTKIKEELYIAIDPQTDDVVQALRVFSELRNRFSDEVADYPGLAIATAVTWDREQRAVYDYERHQMRTKSNMPDGLLDAFANFQYIVESEDVMQGRTQALPWEFLVHLVNHKTPIDERRWAVANYLPRRQMFGKCYHDVPYDDEMLETQSASANLNGKDYTLANLAQYGGVCAMQADFAARIGKSIGVPAEYVRGPGNTGSQHAWVMWVELQSVNKNGIRFHLESYGRYRGDKFYVGELLDPRTGRWITDRELELQLHSVGVNPRGKRQADLVMAAYPMLCEKAKLDLRDELKFLEQILKLSPGNQEAWRALARLSREGKIELRHRKLMQNLLDDLFTTFALFPDFTWTVFDDLVAYEDNPKVRNDLYGKLIALYLTSQRPDLACEARLKLSDYLVKDGDELAAIDGLAVTIKAFPDEGRYVPRMLDKLESICETVEGSEQSLVRFYSSFLPMIPQIRGDRPSEYCMATFERAIRHFGELGDTKLAESAAAELAQIRAGNGRQRK